MDGATALKSWREGLGLSFAEAGKRLGVTSATVWAWEHGRKEPRIGNALRIEEVTKGACPVLAWNEKAAAGAGKERT